MAKQHGKTTARKRTTDANSAPRNKELREEDNVLRIPISSQPQHYQWMQDACHNQGAPFPREASPTLEAHEAWPSETPVHAHYVRRNESSGSTRVLSKRQCEKKAPNI